MKKQILFSALTLIVITLITILSCSKRNSPTPTVAKPTLTTTVSSDVKQTIAQSGGSISSDGGANVTKRGVCWNTSSSPTISNSKTNDGSGTGNFTSSLTGLTANTKYYIRAYATNSAGTAYGNEVSFTTQSAPATLATLKTTDTSSVTDSSVQTGGSITADGGSSVTERGVCWSTSANPSINDSHSTDGNGTGSFISKITGLTASTTYYVRAYATNSVGTAYGNEIEFKTKAVEYKYYLRTDLGEALVIGNKTLDSTVANFGFFQTTFNVQYKTWGGQPNGFIELHTKSPLVVLDSTYGYCIWNDDLTIPLYPPPTLSWADTVSHPYVIITNEQTREKIVSLFARNSNLNNGTTIVVRLLDKSVPTNEKLKAVLETNKFLGLGIMSA